MSLTRKQKEKTVEIAQKELKEAVSVVFMAFDGLSVEEVSELRDSLSEAGGKMRVIPKRLLKIVLANIKIEFDPTQNNEQLAVVWGDDVVKPAKVINEFVKKHEEQTKIMAGVLEGNTLSLEEVKQLAGLPDREQLVGQLLSVLVGPARGLVQVFSGVQRNTVQVLQAIADKKS